MIHTHSTTIKLISKLDQIHCTPIWEWPGIKHEQYCVPFLLRIKLIVCYIYVLWTYTYIVLTERDLFLVVLTFVSCLVLGVEIGLLTGVVTNVIFLLYLWARPTVSIITCKVRKCFSSEFDSSTYCHLYIMNYMLNACPDTVPVLKNVKFERLHNIIIV